MPVEVKLASNKYEILIKVPVCTVLHFEWLFGFIVSWKILAPLLDSSRGGGPFPILYFFLSACCALTKKIETKKLHHLIAQHTVYTPTLKGLPPLDFQDLVLLSFIAWNHCVEVFFIFDLVYWYNLNQNLKVNVKSSTHSL